MTSHALNYNRERIVSCQHRKIAVIYYAAVPTSKVKGVNTNLGLPPVPLRLAQFSFVSIFVNSFVETKMRKCAPQTASLCFVFSTSVKQIVKQQDSCYIL